MTSNYPAQIDNTYSLPTAVDNLTPVQGILFNNLRDAVIAIESALGIQPAGPYTNVAARFTNLEDIVGNLKIITLAGDLGGTLANPLVIGIQGNPVSPDAPNFGQVLMANGVQAWLPISFSGDIAQISPLLGNITVININGASVPVAGSLVTGNVLQVSGSSALSYGPVNLAGGSTYVSGILPAANLPLATTSALGIIQLAGDLGNIATAPKVVSLTGAAGVISIASTGNVITWTAATTAPGLMQAISAAGSGANMTIAAQSTSFTNANGGNLSLGTGAGNGSGTPGLLNFNIGGTLTASLNTVALNLTNNIGVLWSSTSATPSIKQTTTGSATGQAFTIQAQSAVTTGGSLTINAGAGATTGGLLTLASGTGTTPGGIRLNTGAGTAISITGGRVVTIGGSVAIPLVTQTGNYTIDSVTGSPDYIVLCDPSAPMTITLPPPTLGRLLIIKDISGVAATNNITIAPNASEQIEGLSSAYTLATDYGIIRMTSDGTNWWIV